MANRLTRKFGVYLVGNVSTRLLGALLLPIYAFSVTPSEFGRYDLILTLGQMFAPLAFVAIWEAALRFLIAESELPRDVARATIVTFSICCSLASLCVGGLFLLISAFDALDVIGVTLVAILFGLVQIWQFVARADHRSKLYMASGIWSALATFVLVICFVVILQWGLSGLIWSYVIGQLVILFAIEVRLGVLRSVNFRRVQFSALRAMLRYSAPLVLNLLSLALLTGFGKILIVATLGDSANGVYSFAMKFATIVVSLGTIISMSVIEEGILRAHSSGLAEFYSRVLGSLVTLLLMMICVAVPWINVFFELVRGTGYESARVLISPLMLFAVVSVLSTHFGSVFLTVSRTAVIGASTVVGAGVSIALSIILIHPLQVFGIALALVVGSFVTMVYRLSIARRHIPFRVHWTWWFTLFGVFAAVSVATEVFARSGWVLASIALASVLTLGSIWPVIRALRELKDIPDVEVDVEYR